MSSPYRLLCPKPCPDCAAVTHDLGVCDPTCELCWSTDPLNPGLHVFEIAARSRFGNAKGEYFESVEPMGLQVRAYSLRSALHVASMAPFHRWFPDEPPH